MAGITELEGYQVFSGKGTPDAAIASGSSDAVVAKNYKVKIIDKSTGNVLQEKGLKNWFSDLGVDGADDQVFDPRAVYDHVEDRYILIAAHKNDNKNVGSLVLSASSSSDPSNHWHELQINLEDGVFPDFPGLAFHGDYITLTGDIVNHDTGDFEEARAYVVNKSNLYDGVSTTFREFKNLKNAGGNTAFTWQPVAQPNETGNFVYYINSSYSGSDSLTVLEINDPLGSNPSRTRHGVPVSSYSIPPEGEQKQEHTLTDVDLEAANGSAFTSRGVYDSSADSIWCAHAIAYDWGDSTEESILKYYEIDTSDFSVSNSRGYGTNEEFFWYPAIEVHPGNSTVIAHARSGYDRFPGVSAVAIDHTDKSTIDSNKQLKGGESEYAPHDDPASWGDYFAIDTNGSSSSEYAILGEYGDNSSDATTYGQWLSVIDY